MKYMEQIEDIKVCADRVIENGDIFIDVTCYRGSDVIAEAGYCVTGKETEIQEVVEKVLSRKLDIFTSRRLHFKYANPIKINENTYRIGKKDFYCRIGNTRYFKHISKSQ